jgi:hypothetical protein
LRGFFHVTGSITGVCKEFAPIQLYKLKTGPQLHNMIVVHPTLTGQQKVACALIMAEADKALCDGADEELWILEVALQVHKAVTA